VKIVTDFDAIKAKHTAITVGTFDGLHLGHNKLIRELGRLAQELRTTSIVFTFEPHPRKVLKLNDEKLKMLNTLDEKIWLLNQFPLDYLFLFPFTTEFAQMSYDSFVKDILIDRLHMKYLIVGYDNHFGRNREGDSFKLKQLAQTLDFQIFDVEAFTQDEITISSTKLRRLLEAGDVRSANNYLTLPYAIHGEIVKGNQLGRTISFPTANVAIAEQEKLIPGDGVYAVLIQIGADVYKGMLNIGHRPTIKSSIIQKIMEVHILNFDGDIYGAKVRITFIDRIRNEQKFDSLQHLKAQLTKDKQQALTILDNM